MLVNLILYLHIVILILICIAPFRLPKQYLIYYILFILLMILQWQYLNGCVLTNWESKLSQKKQKALIRRIIVSLGINKKYTALVSYSIIMIVLAVAVFRLVYN